MTVSALEIIDSDPWRVEKLSDEQLVETFVAEVLNGLDTGSREEALAEELVDRFSAVVGIEASSGRG